MRGFGVGLKSVERKRGNRKQMLETNGSGNFQHYVAGRTIFVALWARQAKRKQIDNDEKKNQTNSVARN